MQCDDNKGGKTMKITKRQLRRIIKEEINKMRIISEADAQPSLEDLDKLINKKMENVKSMEGMRMMDPAIDDAIEAELAAIGKLRDLHRKMRGK